MFLANKQYFVWARCRRNRSFTHFLEIACWDFLVFYYLLFIWLMTIGLGAVKDFGNDNNKPIIHFMSEATEKKKVLNEKLTTLKYYCYFLDPQISFYQGRSYIIGGCLAKKFSRLCIEF